MSLSRLDAMIMALGMPGVWKRHRHREPREKDVKQIGPRPDGEATEGQKQITTGPKRGKGTRKQRKAKR